MISEIKNLTFSELKKTVCKATLEWKDHDYDNKWLRSNMNRFCSVSELKVFFRDMVVIYRDYLLGIVSKQELLEQLSMMEQSFDEKKEIKNDLDQGLSFYKAMMEAFKHAEDEFGTVSFECPKCKGKASGSRTYTPEHLTHKITIRAFCSSCGMSLLN